MKCGYCGKRTSGNTPYCSNYCREKGEAKKLFGNKTRVPFAISQILAAVAALTGLVLIVAGKTDTGFLLLGGGLALSGIGMLAFPRAGRGANAFCHVGGSLFFAFSIVIFLLWR